jgi:capsular polysaccharide export protein
MTIISANKYILKGIECLKDSPKISIKYTFIATLLLLSSEWKERRLKSEIIQRIKNLALGKTPNINNVVGEPSIVAALPWKCDGMNSYIPYLLGCNSYKTGLKPNDFFNSDIYVGFGVGRGKIDVAINEAAKQKNQNLLKIEYGFISSFDIALKGSPQHSIIVCPNNVMYYDAFNESSMERDLNDLFFRLDKSQFKRARKCIEEIVKRKVTKYNHASTCIKNIVPKNGRKKILLIDQRYGDASIRMGLADESDFERMWNKAVSLKDHDIIVKIHPDAISGGKESCLSRLIPKKLPSNVYLIDEDINPYVIIAQVDKVFTCVSQMGFEALMAGKDVHCFGVAFYAGWGLTTDYKQPMRERRKRTIYEIFYIYYIEYSRYYIPEIGSCELEDIIEYFGDGEKILFEERNLDLIELKKNEAAPSTKSRPFNIILVIPSARFGATGRYFQEIAKEIRRCGCGVMVLSEAHNDQTYEGVNWIRIEFDGIRLSSRVRNLIQDFSPEIVYESGVRSRAQRAAIEIVLLTGAKLVLQSEDDDLQVYKERHPSPNVEAISALDKPIITRDDLKEFIDGNNWEYTLSVLADPGFDRWVEPLLRSVSYHLSSFNTAIWYPFEERLKKEFGKPTMVVPPVVNTDNYSEFFYEKRPLVFGNCPEIKEENLVLFLGGTIYDYSPEYKIFLNSLNLLCERLNNFCLTLIVVSGRSNLDVSKISFEILDKRIQFIDMGFPTDDDYMDVLKYCDIVCSPGLPDRFNLYRLPSRLVKAMCLGKPVLTCCQGFGQSLSHEENAILLNCDTAEIWANNMSNIFDRSLLREIGKKGRIFAVENFDSKKVVNKFIYELNKNFFSNRIL